MPDAEASDDLGTFRANFWNAFRSPRLKTTKFGEVRAGLEAISDTLAGPLFSIYERGECDYVFRDRSRFPGADDARTFLEWCLAIVADYRKQGVRIQPTTDEEREDQRRILESAEQLGEISQLGYRIVEPRLRSRTS